MESIPCINGNQYRSAYGRKEESVNVKTTKRQIFTLMKQCRASPENALSLRHGADIFFASHSFRYFFLPL